MRGDKTVCVGWVKPLTATHRSILRALCARLLTTVGLRFANPTYALPLALLLCLPSAHAAEQISIPAAGISSSPEPLVAYLYKPATPGPHPAIVMLHGCGGMYDNKGAIGARQNSWGEYALEHGYAALVLDSFTSRGLKEVCTVKYGDRTIKESERVSDAYAALTWLRQQGDIDAKRIAVLGWSHGGGVTLDTITRKPKTFSAEGFKAAVSFYPGCTARNKRADGLHPYAPLLLLIGESDDWTPAAPCKELATSVAARGEPMSIVTYPDTYHDFDNPGITRKNVRKEVPNGVNPGQGVTTAPNPEAREDAKKRVLAFFAEPLK